MDKIQVFINGEETPVPRGSTVQDLVEHLGLGGQPAAVEVNKALVPKRRHAEHVVSEGDRLEVVTLVGGG